MKLSTLILPALLTGLMALTACGQPPSPVTSPSTPAPVTRTPSLGLFELNVNGVGAQAGALSSSVRRVGLGPQANEVGGLTFTAKTMTSVADLTTGTMHLVATYMVTNNTGTPVALPTYVPVDTAGAYATDAETPFRNVVTRRGVPIAPDRIRLERGNYSNGGVVQENPAYSPFVSNLDTGALGLTLPAGTTAPGISHQGWQSAALPVGGSVDVDFAVRVKLQGSDVGDNDPFRFSLVFAVADSPASVALSNIAELQGSTPNGDAPSPVPAASPRTVEGVVTSVNTAATGLSGYFLQEEGIDSDGDVNTSDGIFVYCASACPADLLVGDRVRVTGTLSEFFNLTELTTANAAATVPVVRGVPVPQAQTLTLPLAFGLRERYEGMRVSVSGKVTNNFTLGRFGSFDVADSRIYNFTQLNAPSVSGNAAYQVAAKDRYIRIDDGTRAQNPDPEIFAENGQPLSAASTLRGGESVTATGVLSYSNDGGTSGSGGSLDTYRIIASAADVSVTPGDNPRPAAPDAVGGSLRVVGMNILNFFTTIDGSNSGCTAGGSGTSDTTNGLAPRGANSCAEFTRQRTKTVNAIRTLNPDVLGVLEMQNDFVRGANSSAQNLVNALNDPATGGTPGKFAYINPGDNVGGDAIAVTLIYQPGTVTPVGRLAILDNSFDPSYTDNCSRPTLAHTFQSNANGGRFTAVMMHLKSKGSACSVYNDADTGDGQGNAYVARRNAATAIVNWLNTNPTGVAEPDRILLGDYNAYASEEPLTILANGGYTNLFDKTVYSYQFDGQWGSLDHATGSASLRAQVTGQTKWHINADEPIVLDYNVEFKSPGQVTSFYDPAPFRTSDHDPVLVGLNLTAQTPIAPSATVALSPDTASVSATAGGAAVTQAFTAVSTGTTGSTDMVTVTPIGAAPTGVVTAPANFTSGVPFNVTVTAPAGTAAGTYTYAIRARSTSAADYANDVSLLTVTVGSGTGGGPVSTLVISQVYGGGGNSGATYRNDFIELFNRSAAPVSTAGMSLQYASSTTAGAFTGTPFALPTATIPAGGYFLVQMAAGTGGTINLPTPDATGTFAMSGTTGQVALSRATTAITGATDPNVLDFVGYGGATQREGTSGTPVLSNTTAALRAGNGCTDTNQNGADFTAAAPTPRNSASPLNVCTP